PEGGEHSSEVLLEEGIHRVTRTTLHTPKGDLTSMVEEGLIPHDPLVAKTTEYYVKEPEDWRIIIELLEHRAATAKPRPGGTVQEAFELMGDDGVASVGISSAFHMIATQRGMQELFYDLYDCPDLLREAHRHACDIEAKAIEALLMSPSEVAWYDICWATGMSLGPRLFDEWLGEELARICGMVREAPGRFIALYTLGRMREIMPTMMNARPHMIATFEPNEGDVSLREAKELYGDKVAIMGNFDSVILAHGSLEDARDEARRCLDEGMAGGGYIMTTGDEVPADTKHENLQAMVDVVEEFGRY
ncbi:MAG: uroporphyrinogen decarboxylase family protein, partial [Armatimonadota bacterium]